MTRAAALVLLVLAGCAWWAGGATVRLPGSDACTLSPDVVGGTCCYLHDAAYARGALEADGESSVQARFAADAHLLACLADEGLPEPIAETYYRAVRAFGWARWRY